MFFISKSKANTLMVLVALFAFLVGLYNLGDARLSSDELKTLTTIEENTLFGVLFNFESSSHVFFTFVLSSVYHLTDKLYVYRAVPVVFGLLGVAMAYRAGKVMIGPREALAATFLLTVTPIFVQYLREMRGYAATVFFGMVILYSLWRGIATNQKRYWISLVTAAVLGIYTHLYFILILGPVTFIVAAEWLLAGRDRMPQARPGWRTHLFKSYFVSLAAVGIMLVVLYGPIVAQILAVPDNQTLRAPAFGPIAPTGQFVHGFVNAFHFMSPLENYNFAVDFSLIFVIVGCLRGLWVRAKRRATGWLIAWWLVPFIGNLGIMVLAEGSSAQVRFHLHTLPAYLLLGASGLLAVADFPAARLAALSATGKTSLGLQRLAVYGTMSLLLLAFSPPTMTTLEERTDEAWSAVGAYLRAEVQPGDLILCEAFRTRDEWDGDNGSCRWHLQDVVNETRPRLPIQPLSRIANFRSTEPWLETLQKKGRVWFVIYFPGSPPYPIETLDRESSLKVRQFRHTWVVRIDSGRSLLGNLIDCSRWLLNFVPDEKHQFDYHVDLAQLYALAGDLESANSQLEQALPIQQASGDPDWAPELAKLREAAASVRFYAPAPPTPQHRLNVNFDHRLELDGYSLDTKLASDVSKFQITFYWQTLAPLEKNYSVFVHLKDATGNIVAYFDFQPFDAILPTAEWPVGIELREARQFTIPDKLSAGEYTFVIGLYLPETMSRLRVIDDPSGENAITLGVVSVEGS